MCLVIDTSIHNTSIRYSFFTRVPEPMVADTNLICHKILCKTRRRNPMTYCTPFRNQMVIFDDYDKSLLESDYNACGLGFSYEKVGLRIGKLTEVYHGVHAYRTYSGAKGYNGGIYPYNYTGRLSIHKCIIPEGTKYYLGTDDEVVAEKMIVFENFCAFIDYQRSHPTRDL